MNAFNIELPIKIGFIQMHKSDSEVQKNAECLVIRKVNEENYNLSSTKVILPDSTKCQVDGYNAEKKVIAEVYCHVGKLKGGQKAKVAKDILKMLYIEKAFGFSFNKILFFICPEAKESVCSGWLGKSIKAFGIEVIVVDIHGEIKQKIMNAQLTQTMTNA